MNDLRYACRLLRRDLGYTAVAILTIAVGIGATTTLFSVAYGVLLKPLPWADGGRLVRLTDVPRLRNDAGETTPAPLPDHVQRWSSIPEGEVRFDARRITLVLRRP